MILHIKNVSDNIESSHQPYVQGTPVIPISETEKQRMSSHLPKATQLIGLHWELSQ